MMGRKVLSWGGTQQKQIMALYVTEGHAGQARVRAASRRGPSQPRPRVGLAEDSQPGPGSGAASQRTPARPRVRDSLPEDMLGGPEAAVGDTPVKPRGPRERSRNWKRLPWAGMMGVRVLGDGARGS